MIQISDHKELAWEEYDGSFPILMKHGFELFLRPGCEYSRKRYVYRIAESNELDYLKTVPMQNKVCFDIGANIGYWSKFLLEVSGVRELHSFEPDPVTSSILKRNLAEYSSRVIVNQVAVGNKAGGG